MSKKQTLSNSIATLGRVSGAYASQLVKSTSGAVTGHTSYVSKSKAKSIGSNAADASIHYLGDLVGYHDSCVADAKADIKNHGKAVKSAKKRLAKVDAKLSKLDLSDVSVWLSKGLKKDRHNIKDTIAALESNEKSLVKAYLKARANREKSLR